MAHLGDERPTAKDRRLGQRFGDYLIEDQIGRGGMGVVFRARNTVTDQVVALKLMAPDLADNIVFRERFIREAEAGPNLGHPNIVPVFETGDADGELFIAMELIEGTDLKELIQRDGPLDPKRALSIFRQAASALDAAHESGMVHRDVKPQNILIVPRETPQGSDRAYLTDFGLVRPMASETSASRTGQVFGSVAYMAPELIEGIPADGRADVYALGCVLYETLTGKVPFERDNEVSAVWAHIHEDPPLLTDTDRDLPGGLNDAVFKAMAKHPDDRFLTCGELINELELGLGRKLSAVKYAHVRPLVARIPRRKTEREVWAPNFFPELSRVRAASRERFDWRKGVALVAAVALLSSIQMGREGGIPQAAADVAEVADSVAETMAETVVDAVIDTESEPEEVGTEVGSGGESNTLAAAKQISPSDRKKLRALLPTEEKDTSGQQERRPSGSVAAATEPGKIVWAKRNESAVVVDTDLWVMDSDGDNKTRLTDTTPAEYWPSWSPDGRHIAYVRIELEQDLWIMDADGSNQQDLGLCLGVDNCGKLAWSPNGLRVAYAQGKDLYVADLATGTRDRVVAGTLKPVQKPNQDGGPGPTWSPDGKSLAFACGESLCLIPADGGPPQEVAPGQGTDFTEPEWSPTGRWIAFGHSPSVDVPSRIYVARPDGSERRQLSTVTGGAGRGCNSASWASDATAVAFSLWQGNQGLIYRIEADGSGLVQLTSGPGDYTPDWWGSSQ